MRVNFFVSSRSPRSLTVITITRFCRRFHRGARGLCLRPFRSHRQPFRLRLFQTPALENLPLNGRRNLLRHSLGTRCTAYRTVLAQVDLPSRDSVEAKSARTDDTFSCRPTRKGSRPSTGVTRVNLTSNCSENGHTMCPGVIRVRANRYGHQSTYGGTARTPSNLLRGDMGVVSKAFTWNRKLYTTYCLESAECSLRVLTGLWRSNA